MLSAFPIKYAENVFPFKLAWRLVTSREDRTINDWLLSRTFVSPTGMGTSLNIPMLIVLGTVTVVLAIPDELVVTVVKSLM